MRYLLYLYTVNFSLTHEAWNVFIVILFIDVEHENTFNVISTLEFCISLSSNHYLGVFSCLADALPSLVALRLPFRALLLAAGHTISPPDSPSKRRCRLRANAIGCLPIRHTSNHRRRAGRIGCPVTGTGRRPILCQGETLIPGEIRGWPPGTIYAYADVSFRFISQMSVAVKKILLGHGNFN